MAIVRNSEVEKVCVVIQSREICNLEDFFVQRKNNMTAPPNMYFTFRLRTVNNDPVEVDM